MNIKILELDDNHCKFIISNTSISICNGIRRILLSEIPTLSIDMVYVEKNCSVLPDEVICHRLGLIPLYSGDISLKDTAECPCEKYCPECSIAFYLEEHNTSDKIKLVTAKNIETDDSIIRTNSIITKLNYNQSIKLKGSIIMSTAKVHSKWAPVAAVAYNYDPYNITADNNKDGEHRTDSTHYKNDITQVEMDIEVVEGVTYPLKVLKQALIILRDKIQWFTKTLEAQNDLL